MQAKLFNLAALAGLVIMFAGGWVVFGLGYALLGLGAAIWLTALLTLFIAIGSRRPAG
jgi:hypothetical protein